MSAHHLGLRLDDLSDWELPPPAAGDMRPVRVFDSAEAAFRFLASRVGNDSLADVLDALHHETASALNRARGS